MAFVSYAQNGEDVLLHRIFGGQETGFYVDVGAYHPVEGSVTKAFYDRGWTGINVEPGSVFEELAAARPRDVNLRMVVLDRSGMAAFSENPVDAGMSRVTDDDAAPGVRPVPCDTLENIVRLHSCGQPVDFLKVDAEGAEGAIVGSTDWRRFRPRVLVFEATLPWSNILSNQEWEPALLRDGYVRVYFDGINCYYIQEEELPILGQYFNVPVNVLDNVERYDARLSVVRETELEPRKAETRPLGTSANTEMEQVRVAFEAERAQFQSEREVCQVECSRLRAELKASQASRDELWAEREQFRTSVAIVGAQVGTAGESGDAPPAEMAATTPVAVRGKGVRALRRAIRLAYSVVRPVVRPIAHRVRTFVTAPQVDAANALRQELAVIRALVEARQYEAAEQSHAVTEMRRLAAEMERAILTLAMESGTLQRR